MLVLSKYFLGWLLSWICCDIISKLVPTVCHGDGFRPCVVVMVVARASSSWCPFELSNPCPPGCNPCFIQSNCEWRLMLVFTPCGMCTRQRIGLLSFSKLSMIIICIQTHALFGAQEINSDSLFLGPVLSDQEGIPWFYVVVNVCKPSISSCSNIRVLAMLKLV